MAFKLYSTDDGHVPAWEYFTVASGVKAEVGLGLAFNGAGKLIASKTPTHICMMQAETETLGADTVAPVVTICSDQVWESQLHVKPDSVLYPGMKVGLSTSALYVDPDNDTDDVFEITNIAPDLADQVILAPVRGRFV